MAVISVLAVTEFEDGSIMAMADAFCETAEAAGHTVYRAHTEPSHQCHGCGHCEDGGCGDPDCLCTFRDRVGGSDAVVYALPTDDSVKLSSLKRIIAKTAKDAEPGKRRLFVMSCSPSFDESAFFKVSDQFSDLCRSLGWEFGGDALIAGLPDGCQGGDPLCRKKAKRLAESLGSARISRNRPPIGISIQLTDFSLNLKTPFSPTDSVRNPGTI